jgi:glycogen debranching enzyme
MASLGKARSSLAKAAALAVSIGLLAAPVAALGKAAGRQASGVSRPAAENPTGDFPLPDVATLLERLKISVPPASPRTFLYTNKRAAFYAGMTSAPNRDPNQGLNVFGRKILEDYSISVDGRPLDRASAVAVDVYPHALVRRYPKGLEEEVSMLDGIDAILVTVNGPSTQGYELAPYVAGVAGAGDCEVQANRERARLTVTPREGGDLEQKTPRTVVACVADLQPPAPGRTGSDRWATVAGTSAKGATERFAPGVIGIARRRQARFVLAVGRDAAEAAALAARLPNEAAALVAARRERIARLLLDTYVETADPRFDKALAWIKASGDALVTEQAGPGIWAGLYWFNDYWGRDTFISLPGIRLVTGQLADARRILESFARFQKTDPKDPLFGRIPNRVRSADDVIYNTVDGTPWFVREAFEYVVYSGDVEFARAIYPAVKRATDGTLKYRVDENGLVVHEDADTWMDAKWQGRAAWSPRGNRAVDVQALWHAQLEASTVLAGLTGDETSARRWNIEKDRVAEAIHRLMRNAEDGTYFDHLNADDTPDRQIRPNGIFLLTAPLGVLLSLEDGVSVLRQVVNELTYPHGVASLSQKDPNFHPWHRDDRWLFGGLHDAAYHNGTVWVWTSGPVISALVRYDRADMAFELTKSMADKALDAGAVGTLSELLDAVPRDGKNGLSGTESQAWSVAEFVRVFYQDYLGVRPEALSGQLSLLPNLPKGLGTVRAVVPYRGGRIKVTLEPVGSGKTRCVLYAPKGFEGVLIVGALDRESETNPDDPRLLVGGRSVTMTLVWPANPTAAVGDLRFATPSISPGLKALSGEKPPE